MDARCLWLIRHAKSDWVQGVPDFQRDLNERGRKDGPFMAQWLRTQPSPAQWIWSSTAIRALATARFVAEGFQLHADDIIGVDSLYLASPDAALDVLRGTPPDVTSVAVVFHNPGITDLVNLLAGKHVLDNLPTLGMAQFSTREAWAYAQPVSFSLDRIITPKGVRSL